MEARQKLIATTFINNQGQKIAYKNWRGEDEAKGVVIIVHGLNSHSGYYHDFAWQLVEVGFDVFALDIRGRGQSDGQRYYIDDYKAITTDIGIMVEIAASENPSLPLFVLGHNAGGLFASLYALDYQARLQGIILQGFLFQLPWPRVLLRLIPLISRIAPKMRLIKLGIEYFSRERSFTGIMHSDPLLADERQPARTLQQLLLAAEFLKSRIPSIRLPLLLLHGTDDRIASPCDSQFYLESSASVDKQIKLYEGHYHDLLNDKYSGFVTIDIIRWLNERTGTPINH
jgi:acylglycerol lipase